MGCRHAPSDWQRAGNWLALQQARALVDAPDINTMKKLRDRAIIAVLLVLRRDHGCRLVSGCR